LTEESLSDKGVTFEIKDIINDPTAMAELVEIGSLTTPVTVIDGCWQPAKVGHSRKGEIR